MDRLFDQVFVRPPAQTYVNCISTNPARDKIDVTLAKGQHRQYVSVLKNAGIRVTELAPLDEFPDSVFMQDPALLGSGVGIVGRFGEQARRGEEKELVRDLGHNGYTVDRLRCVEPPGTMEGGDIVVTDRGIFVGESSRSNIAGIKQVETHLNEVSVTPVKTDLFHLLCGCSYLNSGRMIIAPELVKPESFPGFDFIKIPKEYSYACDALYIGDGKVVIPAGFEVVSKKLKDEGYHPVEVDVSEFHKGDGGVTCLSLAVYNLF